MKNRKNKNIVFQICLILISLIALTSSQANAQSCDNLPDHFIFTANTGSFYAIVIDSVSTDCNFTACDEIGVYDGSLCVGAAVFQGSWPLAVTAWKDDVQTGAVDGYRVGNQMTFRVWHALNDTAAVVDAATYNAGDNRFDTAPFAKLWLSCQFEPSNPSCCVPPIRGNIDNSPDDIIDISDLIYLVDWMFRDGPEAICFDEANVTGASDSLDIAELVYLVDWMFRGGPEPLACP